MPLLGHMSYQRSVWPKGWPNVKLTRCSTICGHQMPLPGGTSELRSTRSNLVPLLATRCLYQGVYLTKGQSGLKADQMSSWPDIVPFLATRYLYQGGTSELRSTRPNLVPLLATRCLYQKVHLTKGQSDPKADQMSSWPDVVPILATICLYWGDMSELRSTGPNLVQLLATRCLYQGEHLTKGKPGPKADQMSSWPDIVPFLATRCLYQGYIWQKVILAQRLTKCQADLI